jgi:pilin isopeptide linkage protein
MNIKNFWKRTGMLALALLVVGGAAAPKALASSSETRVTVTVENELSENAPDKDNTEFVFELVPDQEGKAPRQHQQITIQGAGEHSFETLMFTEPGTYNYKVRQVADQNQSSEYVTSKMVYDLTIQVYYDDDGSLTATVIGRLEGQEGKVSDILFIQEYVEPEPTESPAPSESPDVSPLPTETPNEEPSGEPSGEPEQSPEPTATPTPVTKTTNKTNGPKTGDETNLVAPITLLVVSGLALCVVIYRKKKAEHD